MKKNRMFLFVLLISTLLLAFSVESPRDAKAAGYLETGTKVDSGHPWWICECPTEELSCYCDWGD